MNILQKYKFGASKIDKITDAVFSKNGKYLYLTGKTDSNDGFFTGSYASFTKADIWISKIKQDNTISVENISENISENTISPNPSNGNFMVCNKENTNYKICDIAGKEINSGKISNNKFIINNIKFNSGIYFIKFDDNTSSKIIIR